MSILPRSIAFDPGCGSKAYDQIHEDLLGRLRGHLIAPLRHAAVSLHRRQMRSPAQALRNDDRQTRHFLMACSTVRVTADSSCRPPTAALCRSDAQLDVGKVVGLSQRLRMFWSNLLRISVSLCLRFSISEICMPPLSAA
ncbi:MAG: hypothetical protein FD139_3600 [Methylocystaceae bacterium]|nr:MAG: hypothetical protein FD172_3506 [Methylocystaceae bacterium]TXT42428.1 MAG: hypothetical protein FD139_3600 [Methylocystaceae bacterium]